MRSHGKYWNALKYTFGVFLALLERMNGLHNCVLKCTSRGNFHLENAVEVLCFGQDVNFYPQRKFLGCFVSPWEVFLPLRHFPPSEHESLPHENFHTRKSFSPDSTIPTHLRKATNSTRQLLSSTGGLMTSAPMELTNKNTHKAMCESTTTSHQSKSQLGTGQATHPWRHRDTIRQHNGSC